MVEIVKSDKITNLWPAPPSRPIEKSGSKDHPPSNKQNSHSHKSEKDEDEPGNNIDEYA
ncbi:MAG: hypothetical protein QM484_11215 [Woeseiaceae bacterium]